LSKLFFWVVMFVGSLFGLSSMVRCRVRVEVLGDGGV
jgi:hypothetical protein